ncbi:MAG: hypothetical protein MUF49_00980 [Oculatellaceae cyanobacterium Prado106]|jgi:hypothetical protein|nr:hypothetical protein [Oculatellaceae cyanobacterium Prado106]
MVPIIYPGYLRLIHRQGVSWKFKQERIFFNPSDVQVPFNPEDRELRYGLTRDAIAISLFRINGGKPGYYLANLRDREYYYCGAEWQDVRSKLLELGIGRADPVG